MVTGPVKRTGITNGAGLVVFPNLEPGSYTIRALTTNEYAGTGVATAAAGAPAAATINATKFMPQSL